MGEDVLQICYLRQDCLQLILNFCPFQPGQLAQTHGYYGSRLRIGQAKPFDQRRFGGRLILRRPDDLDDFVNIIQRDF